jgi:type IV secretory pathway VirJ component
MRWYNLAVSVFLLPMIDFAEVWEPVPASFCAESTGEPDMSPVFLQQPDGSNFPLIIYNTTTQPQLPMLVYISGDGGLNNFSSSLCNYLNQKGIPVVAMDAQKYFWKSKLPEEAAQEMEEVIEKYRKEWRREKFLLAGFSFGADIIPFIVNRLPGQMRAGLVSSVLISPDRNCDFEIHLSDMLSLGISKGRYDVVREISGSYFRKFAIIFGSDENINTESAFRVTDAKIKVLPGNHHFDSAFETVGDSILSEIR